MAKYRVAVIGTVGKSVLIDDSLSSRVAKLETQIATVGGVTRHSQLLGLQQGDDHPQYTMWQAPETIAAPWNFSVIPFIQGEPLAEYIEDVVAGGSDPFISDSPSIHWTYDDTGNHLQADVVDEYIEDLVGSMLVNTSTVDFTYDDTAGTFSAVVPGAALTKVDDTNVTLTLGGSPTTALARAASLTLGWTGQLAVSRGGSGASTLTGYLKGNGTSAFTASATIPYSDISGTPTIPTGANPTASVGLTAVNGSATTYMRSDGAPPLDVSISPTWTGNHTFTNSGAGVSIQNDTGSVTFKNSAATIIGQLGSVKAILGSGSVTDFAFLGNGTNFTFIASSGRTLMNLAAAALSFGNTTDNSAFNFNGTGVATFGGAIRGPASTTSAASLRLPHGSAPSSPVDGDVWTTTAGLFVRINGVTVGPLS